MKNIVIIGGGIAGLAAAYYIGKQDHTGINITMMEQADYWGGKLVTERIPFDEGSFVIEGGPDTFVVTKPWGVKLCNELGIADRLRGTNPDTKKTYILKKKLSITKPTEPRLKNVNCLTLTISITHKKK